MLGMLDDLFLAHRMFYAFDTNHDGYLDFVEFAVALGTMIRGTDDEKLALAFQILSPPRQTHDRPCLSQQPGGHRDSMTQRSLPKALLPGGSTTAGSSPALNPPANTTEPHNLTLQEDFNSSDEDDHGWITFPEFRDVVASLESTRRQLIGSFSENINDLMVERVFFQVCSVGVDGAPILRLEDFKQAVRTNDEFLFLLGVAAGPQDRNRQALLGAQYEYRSSIRFSHEYTAQDTSLILASDSSRHSHVQRDSCSLPGSLVSPQPTPLNSDVVDSTSPEIQDSLVPFLQLSAPLELANSALTKTTAVSRSHSSQSPQNGRPIHSASFTQAKSQRILPRATTTMSRLSSVSQNLRGLRGNKGYVSSDTVSMLESVRRNLRTALANLQNQPKPRNTIHRSASANSCAKTVTSRVPLHKLLSHSSSCPLPSRCFHRPLAHGSVSCDDIQKIPPLPDGGQEHWGFPCLRLLGAPLCSDAPPKPSSHKQGGDQPALLPLSSHVTRPDDSCTPPGGARDADASLSETSARNLSAEVPYSPSASLHNLKPDALESHLLADSPHSTCCTKANASTMGLVITETCCSNVRNLEGNTVAQSVVCSTVPQAKNEDEEKDLADIESRLTHILTLVDDALVHLRRYPGAQLDTLANLQLAASSKSQCEEASVDCDLRSEDGNKSSSSRIATASPASRLAENSVEALLVALKKSRLNTSTYFAAEGSVLSTYQEGATTGTERPRMYMNRPNFEFYIKKRQGSIASLQHRIQRRRPEYKLLGPSKGFAVHFGHPSWNMVLNMMVGIRLAGGRINNEPRRPVETYDFFMKEKITILPRSQEAFKQPLKSPSRDAVRFIDYAPMVFRKIREFFGLSSEDYLNSIGPEQLVGNMVLGNLASLSELCSEGKSGAFFYYTADGRYLIKTITRDTAKFFRRILKDYYEHIMNNPDTLITRFYGFHAMHLKKSSGNVAAKLYFTIMVNVFHTPVEIHRRYDIKGSWIGRTVGHAAENDSTIAWKDYDMIKRNEKIYLGPERRRILMKVIERDAAFFNAHMILDYSLLVGIHGKPESDEPVLKTAGSQTKVDTSPDTGSLLFDPSFSDSFIKSLNGTKYSSVFELPPAMPLTTRTSGFHARKPFHQRDLGGLASSDGKHFYYLGIIDVLTRWTPLKRLERDCKAIQTKDYGAGVSCVHPTTYARRFINFLSERIE